MHHAETCQFGVNDAGTGEQIDTRLTQHCSLCILAPWSVLMWRITNVEAATFAAVVAIAVTLAVALG
jgi:heterodisulfide reductase subunit A-like polyferredoxin